VTTEETRERGRGKKGREGKGREERERGEGRGGTVNREPWATTVVVGPVVGQRTADGGRRRDEP
jgi:hypothetical protein